MDPAVKTPKVDQVLEQIKSQRQSLQIEERKKVTGAKADTKATVTQRVKTRIPSRPEVTAMMLDFLLCISGFLTVLILTILTTQVDLVKFLTTVPWQEWVPFLYMTVAFTAFIYTTVTRLFSRQTVGEWVTDQYIEVKSPSFAVFFLRVVVRDFLVVATGFVLLPLLSLLLGTDLAGRVSGAYLVKETYV
ncbi:MAG: hypothetical protein NZ480_00970 [Bdellovibrionaceae bacterium]|nr:hypothetical protein [Pseudobdellovibrionaceae bacterium]